MDRLRGGTWKSAYRTGDDDLLNDFFLPALSSATRYDRAVGYFSSELLIIASQGLSSLIKSSGKMRLVIGHPLAEDEYLAVKEGNGISWAYENLQEKIFSILRGGEGDIAKHRLKLLTWMLACGSLEIKFAFRKKGMYHEKIGIITDEVGDRIVFTGSANETFNAMDVGSNAESITVFPSWNNLVFDDYGRPFESGFEKLWSSNQRDTYTIGIPSDVYESISRLAAKDGQPDLDLEASIERQSFLESQSLLVENTFLPYIPDVLGGNRFEIKQHQQNALMKWKANDYRGILKLATGSGKTITSIYGAVKIFEAFGKLIFIVAVPYNELATQWVENLKLFGIAPHKCYDNKNLWYDRFKLDVQAFGANRKKFIAAVVINKTMQSPAFQELVSLLPAQDFLFVGDECHRHGAENTFKALPDASMRMGLSATPFRSEDDEIDSPFPDEGKKRLLEYYGDIVDEYTLSDAINAHILTPYKYHVSGVRLTDEEQEEYEELSKKIGNSISGGVSRKSDRDVLTMLCGKRSRLLGSAENKLFVLKSILSGMSQEEKGHVLFYCAEGSSEAGGEYTKNIDKVSKLLNDFKWRTSQFTSLEKTNERKLILKSFLVGGIDALVSMKVLDEGIDIPACKTAFILASTKNPRQYVQRRGRILRRFEGKDFSVIYDFVILPAAGWEETPASKKLVKSELERINDFMLLAKNKREAHKELEELGVGI